MAAHTVTLPRAFAMLAHSCGIQFEAHEELDLQPAYADFETVIPATLMRAAPRRLVAYLAGRYCAATALGGAGANRVQVGQGPKGAPLWPQGFVGSITHTATRAFATAVPAARARSVGIDCERLLDVDAAEEISGMVLPEAPLLRFEGNGPSLDSASLVTLAFSAKESVYKCLNPLTNVFFEFHDVQLLAVDSGTGRAHLRLGRALAPGFDRSTELEASFSIEDGHVYTAVVLDHSPRREDDGPLVAARHDVSSHEVIA